MKIAGIKMYLVRQSMPCLRGHGEGAGLACAALFLSADRRRMCTGQEFIINGGWV